MAVNAATLDLVTNAEGFVEHWYPDPAHGWKVPTCCYGHTDAAGEPKFAATKGKTFTRTEGREILAKDLEAVERQVKGAVTVPLNDNQLGALVSFTYNLGIGNFRDSTLLKKLNAGDYDGAALQFKRWNKANGKVLKGLVTRRAAEAALFARTGLAPATGATTTPAEPTSPRTDAPAGLGGVILAIIRAVASFFKGNRS